MSRVVHLIAGARPNFVKVAPLWRALAAGDWCEPRIIHTGQHHDDAMAGVFFRDLKLPEPVRLEVGSGTHAEQTGLTMIAYERLCMSAGNPAATIVVGDVNATLACALVAAKLRIPLVHLEAGLRSGDRAMPEEINRLVTDAVSDLLWTPSADADRNLAGEGVAGRVERVGNVMIDSLVALKPRIDAAPRRPGPYAVATLHRPSNVDDPERLARIASALAQVSQVLPVLFALHPRTEARLDGSGITFPESVMLLGPLSYVEFLGLLSRAALAITDSGGVQEETTHLGVSCLTLRTTTERPVTLNAGTNELVSPENLFDVACDALRHPERGHEPIPLWDGHAAERAALSLRKFLGEGERDG